jgi:glycosyltransferase involved in cell wall biosynthesis
MKVSVLMITYNQENYISEAITSILKQNVNFDYEIVISDDHSSDATQKILTEFYNKNPSQIKLNFNEQNIGSSANFIKAYSLCSGEYIAVLEGDDYWNSSDKLQKQIDFLSKYTECVICFSRASIVDVTNNKVVGAIPQNDPKQVSDIEDLLKINFIPTCTVVFKNNLIDEIPKWMYSLWMVDWPFHILNAKYGRIGFINELLATYRKNPDGVCQSTNNIAKYEGLIKMLNYINEYLNYEFSGIVKKTIGENYLGLSEEYLKNNDFKNSSICFWESFKTKAFLKRISFFRYLLLFCKIYFIKRSTQKPIIMDPANSRKN